RCRTQAEKTDDISLLAGIGEKEVQRTRRKGIFTVTQLAYTFRPRRKGRRVRGGGQPHPPALQGPGIPAAKTYSLGKPDVPSRPVRVYLDLEGSTDAAGVYLLGALVVRGDAAQMHSFWADNRSDEDGLLRQLLGIVGEDFALFHFGSYERT